ncbi:MAG: SRPBCC domain-containing protein [Flavobacteriales bacterium]|nr:SRPBCC domain-containing protein [Flavobacteriales bacterium]
MAQDHPAVAHTVLHFPIERVWHALTDADDLAHYMMGAQVTSDWTEGSPITWEGEFKGKSFRDTGKVLAAKPPELLRYTHGSGGDSLEHVVTIELKEVGGVTHLRLTQTNNATEEARADSEKNWQAMLDGLKKWLGEAPVAG